MNYNCYTLSSKPGILDLFKSIASKQNFNFNFNEIKLQKLSEIEHSEQCVLFVDHMYISNDLIDIALLESCNWVLLHQDILVHYKTLIYPPLENIHVGLPQTILVQRLNSIYLKLNQISGNKALSNSIKLIDLKRNVVYQNMHLIVYIEGYGDYSKIFTKDVNQKDGAFSYYNVVHNLKYIEELLYGKQFFRLHRSYIVNINFTASKQMFADNILCLQNNVELPIARRRKKELIAFLEEYSTTY